MRKWAAAIPTVTSFGLSAALFHKLPHAANPDFSPLIPVDLPEAGAIGRLAAALLLPAVSLGLWLFLTRLAKVSSGKTPLPAWLLNESTDSTSIARFEPTYETIIFGVTGLVLLMHAGLLAAVLGLPAWTFQVLTAALGLGMVAIGNVMPRLKPNWIAGVRTKRTLSDPLVWSRTHRLAGMFMMAAGFGVVVASLFAPAYALIAAFTLLLVSFPLAHYAAART